MKALGFEGFSPSWKFVAGRHRGPFGFARAPQVNVGYVLSRSCSLLRAAVVQWSAHRADDRGVPGSVPALCRFAKRMYSLVVFSLRVRSVIGRKMPTT